MCSNRSTLLLTVLTGCIAACAAAQEPSLIGIGSSTNLAPEQGLPLVATPQTALLALSKKDHTLSIVNPATLQVVARVPVGDDPHEVIASDDGRSAFVSNYGGGDLHSLAVVDLIRQKARPAVELGALRGPHGLATRGGKIWFTAEGAKVVASYDPVSEKIESVLGTGQNRTHMLFVSDDQRTIVTSNVGSGTVSILDKNVRDPAEAPAPGDPLAPPPGGRNGSVQPVREGDWDETIVRVGRGPEGFDVSPDGKEIWVANAHDGTISIIDLATKAVKETVEANVQGANRLKFTPDGKRVLVSAMHNPELAVLDVASRRPEKRIPVGHASAGILVQPDGARAYVACPPDNYVAVVDLMKLEVVSHLDVGHEPDGLAWAVRP